MVKAIDVLKANQSKGRSRWKEQAQWHVDNWGWLRHSVQIALRARSRMASLGLTQKDLAERMGCSQQFVSLILKGKENLTLETISKMEKVLDCNLLFLPSDCVDGYDCSMAESPRQYLNEPGREAD